MSPETRPPVLPYGSPTTLQGLSETFSFHSSPEAFITSRVLAFQRRHPTLADSRTPIHAKVLNRNVAVISSYQHVKQILCEDEYSSKISAGKAYEELMAPFFPPPNLLLADPPGHHQMKKTWKARMSALPSNLPTRIHKIVLEYFKGFLSGSTIDLYESMKELSWKLLLDIFTSAPEEDAAKLESLQEDLLRGQFSLFPVSLNTGLWRTPRSKGLAARKELQQLLKARVESGPQGCPFATSGSAEQDYVVNHLLLFTSSLAVKSLASLLTALLLNLFIYCEGGEPQTDFAANILSLSNNADRLEMLESMLVETERLSPPVVGIMRRTTQNVTLLASQSQAQDTLVPKDWDIWLYFVGAARDSAVFGETADLFKPDRYFGRSKATKVIQQGLAFGAGPKSCLGQTLMREVVMTVMKTCLGMNIDTPKYDAAIQLQGSKVDIPKGVQAWLGWQKDIKPEEWAKDMKQLPTQRPSKAITVTIVHNLAQPS